MTLDQVVQKVLSKNKSLTFNAKQIMRFVASTLTGKEIIDWTNHGDVITYGSDSFFLKSKKPIGNALIGGLRPKIETLFNDSFVREATFEQRMQTEQTKLGYLQEAGVNVAKPANHLLEDEDLSKQVSMAHYVPNKNLLELSKNEDITGELIKAFEQYRKLHDANLTHGDAWLGNLGVKPNGEVYIFDFEFNSNDEMYYKDFFGLCYNVLAKTDKTPIEMRDIALEGYGSLTDNMRQNVIADYELVEKTPVFNPMRNSVYYDFIQGTDVNEVQVFRSLFL